MTLRPNDILNYFLKYKHDHAVLNLLRAYEDLYRTNLELRAEVDTLEAELEDARG